MDVPDQAADLGGTFSCPFCRAVVVVAPTATPVMVAVPAKSSDNRRGMVLLAVFIGGGLFVAFPLIGVLLGAACLIWGSIAVAKGVRSPLQLVFRESPKAKLMALGSAMVGVFFMTCAAVGFDSASREAARMEREAEQKAAQEAKMQAAIEERQAEARNAIAMGTEALTSGDVEQAQARLAEAQQLDSEAEGIEELGKAIKEELHRRALATLPERLTAIGAHVDREAWRKAGKECKAAKAIDANFEGLEDACSRVEHEVVLLDRQQAVTNALELAADPDKCETPLSLSEAWSALREIPSDDPSFKKAKRAAGKLEKCRKRAMRAFDKGLRQVMMAQRERYVENLDRALLESGMDTRVTASGQYQDMLKIQWALMGRAMAHKMANDGGIVKAAEKIGFKRVTFTDGYYESFRYDLDPQSEAGGGKAVLDGMGLGERLEL